MLLLESTDTPKPTFCMTPTRSLIALVMLAWVPFAAVVLPAWAMLTSTTLVCSVGLPWASCVSSKVNTALPLPRSVIDPLVAFVPSAFLASEIPPVVELVLATKVTSDPDFVEAVVPAALTILVLALAVVVPLFSQPAILASVAVPSSNTNTHFWAGLWAVPGPLV